MLVIAGLFLDTSCWVLRILKDSNSCLLDLLQTEATPETSTKTLIQELLHLVVVCVNQERVIDYCVADLYPSKTASCWSNFIETIIENLRLSNTQHFYNLGKHILTIADWLKLNKNHLH